MLEHLSFNRSGNCSSGDIRMGLGWLLRLDAFAANSLYSKISGQPRKTRLAKKEQAQNLTVYSFIHFLGSQKGVEIQAELNEVG